MAETWAEEVARLRREIAERQARLHYLVLGDQTQGVSVPCHANTQTYMYGYLYSDNMR